VTLSHPFLVESGTPAAVHQAGLDSRRTETHVDRWLFPGLSSSAEREWLQLYRGTVVPPCAFPVSKGGHEERRFTMRIAQIAPLMESVPPRLYGGTERIVSYLTEELVQLGHDVTLFASGDSVTTAELAGCAVTALRLDPAVKDPIPHYMLMLDQVRERVEEFDILHFHIDLFHFPLFHPLADRTLTTLHGRQDLPDLRAFFFGFRDMPLVSISQAQREPLPHAQFVGTVHHGIPLDLHQPVYRPGGGYLAFLGRISPEKRPDRAIRIARQAGIPLKIAAKVDKVDEAYFRDEIAPLLNEPGVEFIGEINERDKQQFLGDALALLFPVAWPEPFGLVMIEAMACATPVLAFRSGSVPEVVDDGVTGRIVDSEEQALAALEEVLAFDRRAIRRRFEERFTATRMAKDYVSVYRALRRQRKSIVESESHAPLQLEHIGDHGLTAHVD
jgi:glycosyltransferase involved in cell wall biosynthesis